MRGKDGTELAIAYIHGRIDAKIESTIEREIEIWSDRLHVSAMEIKQRMGALSVREEPDSVSRRRLPETVSSRMGNAAPEVEVVSETRTSAQVGFDRNGGSQDAPGQITTRVKGAQGGWRNKDGSAMTSEQRKKEAVRRLKKRTDPLAKKLLGGNTKTPKAKLKKQRLYQARSTARKRGLPLPPLPSEPVENANP